MNHIKNTADRRVMKTKKSIHNAFVKLLEKKEFRAITVTDIAKLAEVNRKTFYNYYECIDDVMKEIIDGILKDLFDDNLEKLGFESFLEHPDELFRQLTVLMNENFDFYATLYKSEEPGNLLQKVEFLVKEKMTAFFLAKDPDNATDIILVCEYCTSGMMAAYRFWFNSGRTVPLEELSKKVCLITESCVKALMGEELEIK